jgi:uroporphyrinogen decarboxylase
MMNKRDTMLSLIHNEGAPGYIPAAFFMHFDSAHHQGQAAVDKHLEFFRYTGMDFVKIQYEQSLPALHLIRKPEDWAHAPLFPDEFFEAPLRVVEGLVKAARAEALVIMTIYSPLMWAVRLGEGVNIADHLNDNPRAVIRGLEIMTENVLKLVRGCKQSGVDGFYASTQGGEVFRFQDRSAFQKYIKPTDLAVWEEIQSCNFNVLHICDYEGGYDDLTPFLDYPGHVVNCSLKVGDQTLAPKIISQMFGRPFMGGLERKGVIASGGLDAIQRDVTDVLAQSPERFILAADCTVPGDTPWEHLKTAIDTAHNFRR